MEALLEIIFSIFFEPIFTILLQVPFSEMEKAADTTKLPKWAQWTLVVLIFTMFMGIFSAIIIGGILLIVGKTEQQRFGGRVALLTGLALLAVYVTVIIIRHVRRKRKMKQLYEQPREIHVDRSALHKEVHVVIDRPLGSTHPKHANIVYEVNYGYVPDVIGGDGEEQDVYVLGVDEPISEFDGVVVAIIHRRNDNENKWVVVPRGYEVSDEEIAAKTKFQEKYFETVIVR